jgi:phosphoribosylanthranilate isomerase
MKVRVKICGVTTPEDTVLASDLGADAVGINFHPASPRYVDRPRAEAILRVMPPFIEAVGVFVERAFADILPQIDPLKRIHLVQWHGAEPECVPRGAVGFIPAFAIAGEETLQRITAYLDRCRAEDCLPGAILVDAHVPGMHGGTGRQAPWRLLADFKPGVPLILAGGLTPENVAEAIDAVRPYAVDVASGVESRPGHKDREKMEQFIRRARGG